MLAALRQKVVPENVLIQHSKSKKKIQIAQHLHDLDLKVTIIQTANLQQQQQTNLDLFHEAFRGLLRYMRKKVKSNTCGNHSLLMQFEL